MSVENLLGLMADGAFHSGEELGQLLGVSRTAVWKQLHKMEQLGLEVESVKGKGYRLVEAIELLDEQLIRAALAGNVSAFVDTIDVHGVIESTNTLLTEKAQAGARSGAVCVAEQQLAGRGRRGRQWVSPYGRNLYFSLLWEFQGGAASLGGLSLAVGLAVARLLQHHGVDAVELKWPNDVLSGGRKLAGILLEMQGEATGACQVVIGIGLNVAMPREVGGIDQPWVDVRQLSDQAPGRNTLLAGVLNELIPVLQEFEVSGFEGFREEWTGLDAFFSQPVKVQLGEQVVLGTSRGVDASGGLLLETLEGERVFYGGEVSLRRAI